jgi:hypothetical protein
MIHRFIALAAAALAVLACASMAAAAKLQGGTRYAGTTSQHKPVQLRLSGNAERITSLLIHYRVTCDSGPSGTTYTKVVNIRVRKSGKFAAKGSYKGSGDGSTNVFKVAGSISRKRARGHFSLTRSDELSGETVHCKSGRLSWRAPRV